MFLRGKPCCGIWAGGLADEVAFVGVFVSRLHEFLRYASSLDGLRNKGVVDYEGVSAQKIGYESLMAFDHDCKAMLAGEMSDIEFHGY